MQTKDEKPFPDFAAADAQPGTFAALARALDLPRPAQYFRALRANGTLAAHFPEIAALVDVPQHPDYHPEGNVFEHTMIVLDRVAGLTADPMIRFAALVHDMGKTLTPLENRIWHANHEYRVAAILDRWHARMPLPAAWLTAGKIVGELHMQVPRIKQASEIVDILEKVLPSPVTVEDLVLICQADDMTGNKPPLDLTQYVDVFAAVPSQAPPAASGQKRRDWIRERRCAAIARIFPGREAAR